MSQAEDSKQDPSEEKLGRKVSKDKYLDALNMAVKAKAESDHWKNEYYRAYADMENLRKQLDADHREAIKYRSEGFLENLLPALDGFHAALSMPAKSQEVKDYLVGFQYIYNQIVASLENEGVSEICPSPGTRYDSTTMHAIDAVEQDGEENLVVKVLAKGYKLKDRLIRPVMVSVSKHPAPKEAPASADQKPKESSGEAPVDEKVDIHKA